MTEEIAVEDREAPVDVAEEVVEWRRLSFRMIWVDAIQSLLAMAPGALAILVFGVEVSEGTMWPLVGIAVFGVWGAVADAMRWVWTRYRVTDEYVERRTGLFTRRYRTVRRDRIRSVDTTAKLRHRLAGLRVVAIGAGQQTNANEAALDLDAITKDDAGLLRGELLRTRRHAMPTTPETESEPISEEDDGEVFAVFRPSWVVFNMFSIWAYLLAAGVLWGGFWLLSTFGIDSWGFVVGLADWEALGLARTIGIGLVGVGAFGVIGMAVNYFFEYWNFSLARVEGEEGAVLRTSRGLLQTREVNRDERRMRGLSIDEPLLWRWMGMADTNIITTGLNLWSTSQPSAILPRGPVSVARSVAVQVLAESPSPFETPLREHPGAALRRRMWWATLTTLVITGLLYWLSVNGLVATGVVWVGAGVWPLALLAAWVAYRALGHGIFGRYLVTRSGLTSRRTAAIRRDAVSTIALRQSILQRRLGLKTVSAMTAAGWGAYEAPDIKAEEALSFAVDAAPGLLDPFLEEAAP